MDEIQPGTGAQPADSPTAPDFSTYAKDADSRDLERASPTPAAAAASPAPSGDQSASTDAKPDAASETATPDDKKPKNAQTRNAELDAEIASLQEKLRIRRTLREELAASGIAPAPKPADSPTAKPTDAEHRRYQQHPDAPQVEKFDTYEEYVAAMSVFIADQRYEERQRRAAADADSQQRVAATFQKIDGFKSKLEKARAADPTLDAKIDPGLTAIVPAFALLPGEPMRPANVLIAEVVESDAAVELMQHFSTADGQREWLEIVSATTPAAMLKRFGRVEARFLSKGQPDGAKPPATPVTSAPAPPQTLGTKPPATADRAAAALRAGDFASYQAEQDARDLAVRRR